MSNEKKVSWPQVGSVFNKEKGKLNVVLKFNPKNNNDKNELIRRLQELGPNEGLMLIGKKPDAQIQGLAKNGVITQEQADERIAKLPESLIYQLSLAPKQEQE